MKWHVRGGTWWRKHEARCKTTITKKISNICFRISLHAVYDAMSQNKISPNLWWGKYLKYHDISKRSDNFQCTYMFAVWKKYVIVIGLCKYNLLMNMNNIHRLKPLAAGAFFFFRMSWAKNFENHFFETTFKKRLYKYAVLWK